MAHRTGFTQDWKACIAILNNYGDAYPRGEKRSGVAGKNKMIKNLTFVVLLSVSMLGCDVRDKAVVGTVYNRELADALQRRDVFDKKRAALTFDSGGKLKGPGSIFSFGKNKSSPAFLIAQLMTPPEPPKKRRIGFIADA